MAGQYPTGRNRRAGPANAAIVGPVSVLAACALGIKEGSDVGITVHGEGRISGRPDLLTLSIGISLERDAVGRATDDAARLAANVVGNGKGFSKQQAFVSTGVCN